MTPAFLYKSTKCPTGPTPCPIGKEFLIASVIYSFPNLTASSTECPFPIREAIVDESVHPVPCVFLVSILTPGNLTTFPSARRRTSVQLSSLCPPF